ncbi:MAG: hypothetical protein IT381_22630 [Deltaproteobacteria bacterium]|nr:hypothetical protein [Deltaproteobacteria bacterium]
MFTVVVCLLAFADAPGAASAQIDKAGAEGESCLSARDCESALECRQNMCVPPGTFQSCQRNLDCSGRLRCRNKQCVIPGMPDPGPEAQAQPHPLQETPSMAPTVAPPMYMYGLTVPYIEGMPIPPGMRVEKRTRVGMWAAGLSLFATSWLLSGLLGSFGLGSPVAWIPIIGAFVSPATVPDFWVGAALATQLPIGIVEVLGGALLIAGFASKKSVLVYGSGQTKATITPLLSPGAQGLAISGTF